MLEHGLWWHRTMYGCTTSDSASARSLCEQWLQSERALDKEVLGPGIATGLHDRASCPDRASGAAVGLGVAAKLLETGQNRPRKPGPGTGSTIVKPQTRDGYKARPHFD
jgi:hypothetical protein